MSDRAVCAACNRSIDASAKVCPYCGADPATGERLDTQALLQEVFQPKTLTTSESVMEYARQRQGIFIAVSAFVAFLIIAAIHQFMTVRNSTAVTDSPAVPLTEITDVTKKADETPQIPMPELEFQYDGQPRNMRTYVVERGAVAPPEVLAAQQAAAQQPNAAAGAQPATAGRPPGAGQQPAAARPSAAPAQPQPAPVQPPQATRPR
ncbi:MAG TPA: zinc ribbon domain-containing protein [Thermoanaerobaculia bacterium]|nr:zinc ribbon domain-containing protein [Thermoanaerobaculia bacterium]